MDKRFWGFLIVIAILISGVFFLSNTDKAAAPSNTRGVLTKHTQGKSPLGITLVEYGDYQCPACGQYYDAFKKTQAKYDSLVVFQFRNFPLSRIHPNAIAGARAAEAADMQGKYWQMHDKLYEENVAEQVAKQQGKSYPTWLNSSDPSAEFNGYAAQIGLDLEKFKTDFKSAAANDRIQADLQEGTRLGVSSTPTFILNGKKISNPNPTVEAFSKIIDAEIVKKGGTPPPATVVEKPATSPDEPPADL